MEELKIADSSGAFGANAWLVEEMYEAYLADPSSVSESWAEFFTDYRPISSRDGDATVAATAAPVAAPPAAAPTGAPAAATTTPVGAQVPVEQAGGVAASKAPEGAMPLRGAAARVVGNMVASLEVPTATSVHPVPARMLEVNRLIINNQLARTTGGKVSFTHLIGWAVVKALTAVPALNSSFVADVDGKGTPGVIRHEHVGLGIAIDLERSDGTRTLLVPCLKEADTYDFSGFLRAYEDLVRRSRTGKITPDDFAGVTVTITNPGTLGTTQSVPRLMPGQGAIIGVGALAYPTEYSAADPAVIAELGISKVVTLTSTYDHRIIQGAESGLFLSYVHELLLGEHDFYDGIFGSLGVPYQPARWHRDVNPSDDSRSRLVKQAHVQNLINIYRVRGHLIAHLDPLGERAPVMHPELDPLTYGLTVWDLERSFVTDGLAGSEVMPLGQILGVLRDAYCRTVGIEYMHIQEPAQKRWIQSRVEGVSIEMTRDEQQWILSRLNATEAFEHFLHSRYIGQKRFGLEGGESTVPLVDAILSAAAASGSISEAVLGMAHRGRLNVLANIVGKSYNEIFAEFEGNLDPETVQGSGDVKYHKGASGKYTGYEGVELPVTLSSNPSHLEAVDPVVEGLARARQDAYEDPASFPVLPLLIHGDAAFAGQGVVAETLNLSGLRGYRTGGTIHVVINNQVGFTTGPESARTSVYPTDVAKMVQAPIFHVNGDDPEACVRVGKLAFDFRQEFHKDVVIDLVCYRLHGHNEGDDPSYTQPLMYRAIENHRSVRKLYTESLVKRGDITIEEAERALEDFSNRLQRALDETRSAAPPKITSLPETPELSLPPLSAPTGVDKAVLDAIEARLHTYPEGFTPHPKLARQFESRAGLYSSGDVDWALAEALAFGSLLVEGVDIRLSGQDTGRGTFSQRHSVLVDYETGADYVPLAGAGPGRFMVYDSLLSEYAALGFEYGYSVEASRTLVAWEAQFGDFANGAQIVIDNFIVAAGEKWGQSSALVLLLPHGYEGQGAEHSSARLERFLTLCANGNMTVAQPTTSAQYFHLLRAQARRPVRRPLIIMTPKSLLRARVAHSLIDQLVTGAWAEVIDDPATGAASTLDPVTVRTVVMCSGKIAFDAIARREEIAGSGGTADTAVIRVEQLYPWPADEITTCLARYPAATEVVWLQDEPENMGPWTFVEARLRKLLEGDIPLRHVTRDEAAAPATGSHLIHTLELKELLDRSVGVVKA
jgi:2-oxoglutarate dehydrogenase E1 component